MPEHLFIPKKGKPRLVKTDVILDGGKVSIYAGTSVLEALKIVSMDLDIYKGVRLSQLLTALYVQGLKNGRREIFDKLDALKDSSQHRIPGRPKKPKKRVKKK